MSSLAQATIPVLSGITPLLADLDLIIFDLWGVIHDGVTLNKEAQEAVKAARATGVKTIFFSNAPRPRFFVANQLKRLGLDADLTDQIVTSGALARDDVRTLYKGQKLYHMGPSSDDDMLQGLDVIFVDQPQEADVILATGLDFRRVEDHRASLKAAAAKNIPFLCANPDRLVHVGDKLIECAGAVADLYRELGGRAIFYGKPERKGYEACLKATGFPLSHNPKRVLMVGDSARTDLSGAAKMGFKSLLVASGIHRDDLAPLMQSSGIAALSQSDVAAALKPHDVLPDYIIGDVKP